MKERLKIKPLITDMSFSRNNFAIYANGILNNCLALNVVITEMNKS